MFKTFKWFIGFFILKKSGSLYHCRISYIVFTRYLIVYRHLMTSIDLQHCHWIRLVKELSFSWEHWGLTHLSNLLTMLIVGCCLNRSCCMIRNKETEMICHMWKKMYERQIASSRETFPLKKKYHAKKLSSSMRNDFA